MQALVLNVDNYRGSSNLVTLLTAEYGIAKCILAIGSYYKYAAKIQMGQLLDLEAVISKSNPEFLRVKHFTIKSSLIYQPNLYNTWLLQNFWSEILSKSSFDAEAARYMFISSQHIFYENLAEKIDSFILVLFSYLVNVGYAVDFTGCVSCKTTQFDFDGTKLNILNGNLGDILPRQVEEFKNFNNYQFDVFKQGFVCPRCQKLAKGYSTEFIYSLYIKYLLAKEQLRAIDNNQKNFWLDDMGKDSKSIFIDKSHYLYLGFIYRIISQYYGIKINSWRLLSVSFNLS